MFGRPNRMVLMQLVRRAFWAIMLAAHTPAWLAALGLRAGGNEEFDALRTAGLTLSQVLFVLALIEVRWLRLKPGRRTWLVLLLSIALLHAGVVERTLRDAPHAELAIPAEVGFLACIAAVVAVAYVFRIGRSSGDGVRPRLSRLTLQSLQAYLPPRFLLLVSAVSVNRAPPA